MLSLDGLLQESREGFQVQPIGLAGMPSWHFCDGALSHVSGGFFSVVGVRLEPSERGRAVMRCISTSRSRLSMGC